MPKSRRAIRYGVRQELWGRAAGRCEFLGCNKLLYKDGLTQEESNLAIVAHIVAQSPDGPRGDPVDSLRLEVDISNLMLTCQDHGKIIDDAALVGEYPVERLKAFKREHEDRVRRLTEIQADMQTHVLIVQGNIGGKRVAINRRQVRNAVLPMYPTNEEGFEVDLTGMVQAEHDEPFWGFAATELEGQVDVALRVGGRGRRPNHVSVFALAPIALLVKLGTVLGSTNEIDVYQKHRDGSWKWKGEDGDFDTYYDIIKHGSEDASGRVAIVLSISGKVQMADVEEAMAGDFIAYELCACEPGSDFLESKHRLDLFGYEYRKLLRTIREQHPAAREIHLFAAAPCPVAILCGQHLSEKTDAPMVIYEYDRSYEKLAYRPVLTVNQATGGPR